jgi:acyl transferase domain-containing protein
MSEREQTAEPTGLEVAVIGMSGRFPGAGSVDEFWGNLLEGRESIRRFTDDELKSAGIAPETLENPAYVKAAGVLDGVDLFDAAFFGFNPREAQITDPQQRIFLECAWEAMEQAGYAPGTFDAPVGVYAGSTMSSYLHRVFSDPALMGLVGAYPVILANDKDFLPTRVSYKLDLRGPSMAVQTACSTSLVAVHTACRALLGGECSMALAGGVSVGVPEKSGYLYQEGSILSPDGHCRAFSEDAAGTLSGAGCGVVLLKRLEDAIADGDTIHAVIKGSAVNNDGSQKVGFTAPSVDGQAHAISEAMAMAEFHPDTMGYVEAHGTGTPLGDPIEIEALTQAYRAGTTRTEFCAIGSAKSNVGHLDAAAGVAGLIKAAMAVREGVIPQSLHCERPNPRIGFEATPFRVASERAEWSVRGPRRAGVSSFGVGGTNAHVVLEQAPHAAATPDAGAQVLVLSARTDRALDDARARLARHLESGCASLADTAFTLQKGRAAMEHRVAVVAADAASAAHALAGEGGRAWTGHAGKEPARVSFMFPGQGSQYVDMGRGLYDAEPVFRDAVDRCARLLAGPLGYDLRTLLYPAPEGRDEAVRRLDETAATQPALFTVEYALAQLWISRGVSPASMIGHSIGEYAAACVAGVFTLEAAVGLVAARGRLMQALPAGAMVSVPLSEDEVAPMLCGELSLAAANGPEMVVVSGPQPCVDEFIATLLRRDIGVRRLATSHAFHSSMMDPILAEFTELVREARPQAPSIPFISNLSGTWITAEEAASPRYWADHLRGSVRFAAGVREVLRDPAAVLLEVGPGRSLSTFARASAGGERAAVAVPSLRRQGEGGTDAHSLLEATARLWAAGAAVQWDALHDGPRRRVALPTYPFQRERFWVDAVPASARGAAPARTGRGQVGEWFHVPSWRRAAPARPAAAVPAGEQWLVFADRGGVGDALAAALRGGNARVSVVRPGSRFASLGGGEYTLDPAAPREYDALLRSISAAGGAPKRVAHCWALDAAGFAAAQDAGFHSVLGLVQALARTGADDGVEIAVATAGAFEVTGSEDLRPETATLAGLCRVVPQEYPELSCRLVDLGWDGRDAARAGASLLAELRGGAADAVAALRGGHRWLPAWEAAPQPPAAATVLRPGGVCLITGGLGRLGLLLAGHLFRTAGARLVLVGRQALPERGEWEVYLASHADDATSARIRALLALEEAGAEVMVAAADVGDAAAMRRVVDAARARWGGVHGVVHAAAVSGESGAASISETDAAHAGAHFRAKALGALALDEALAGESPDFCLFMSSLSTVLGGLKFGAYAAANAFLDAHAHRSRRQGGLPWISVDWDGWLEQDTVPEGALGMAPAEGLDAFDRALASGATQLAVSTGSLAARRESLTRRAVTAAPAAAAKPAAGNPRGHLSSPYVAPRDEFEERVAEVWSEFLGVEQVGVLDDFLELGGHSLLGVQILSRLRREFQVDLSVDVLFRSPTVEELAGHVTGLLLAEIEAMSEEEALAVL